MKLKFGDRVRLVRNESLNADIGATGTVVATMRDDWSGLHLTPAVFIEWDDGPLRNGQMNGLYSPSSFELEKDT